METRSRNESKVNETLNDLKKNSEKIESNLSKLSNDMNLKIQTTNEMIESTNDKLHEIKSHNDESKNRGAQFNSSSCGSPSQPFDHESIDTDNDNTESFRYHSIFGDSNVGNNIGFDTNKHDNKKSLRIPKSCKNVLLGDSNLKMVERTRLDNTKSTEIRTYHGASVKKLNEYVSSSQYTYPDVKKVSLSVGSVDCSRRYLDEETLINDYDRLLSNAKKIFPSAALSIVSIPPHGNSQTTKAIWKINKGLKSLASHRNVTFCYCEALWMHTCADGSVDDGILARDNIHLTLRGVGLMLRPITKFFFGNQRYEQPRSKLDSSQATLDENFFQQRPMSLSIVQSTKEKDTLDHRAQVSASTQYVQAVDDPLKPMNDSYSQKHARQTCEDKSSITENVKSSPPHQAVFTHQPSLAAHHKPLLNVSSCESQVSTSQPGSQYNGAAHLESNKLQNTNAFTAPKRSFFPPPPFMPMMWNPLFNFMNPYMFPHPHHSNASGYSGPMHSLVNDRQSGNQV